ARTGYPRPAFRTLEKHCYLDPNHRNDFDQALDRMPLQEEHHAILEISALHTVRMAARAYREGVERAAETELQRADMTAALTLIPARRPDLIAWHTGDNGAYRLEDPVRGTAYQIGEQEYFLLTYCDGRRSAEAVRHAYTERFGQPLTDAEL